MQVAKRAQEKEQKSTYAREEYHFSRTLSLAGFALTPLLSSQPFGSPRMLYHRVYRAYDCLFLFSFENHDATEREYALLVRQLTLPQVRQEAEMLDAPG